MGGCDVQRGSTQRTQTLVLVIFANSLFRDNTLFGFTVSNKRRKIRVFVMQAAFETRRVVNIGISKVENEKLDFF
jgi:hypothetical protein